MSILKRLLIEANQQLDISILFLEFEEVFIVSVGFLLLLIYLFYFRYPINKEFE
jgi:hypothetical protein